MKGEGIDVYVINRGQNDKPIRKVEMLASCGEAGLRLL